MKHSCRWLLFEQLLFFPKHVTLSEKMRLALLVSFPASCFFDHQGLHDKNLKGDICGFPNWDWKIWKQSLSLSEHCKKTTHHTKWPSPIFLNLSRAFCMCGCVDINWVTVMRAGGRYVNSNLFQWEVPACLTEFLCWDIPQIGSLHTMPENEKNQGRCMIRNWRAIFVDFRTEIGRFSISEHCKKTTHHKKWPSPIVLNLSRASCMCGCVDINWVTVMPAGGRHVNSNLFQWEVPACLTKFLCWYIP